MKYYKRNIFVSSVYGTVAKKNVKQYFSLQYLVIIPLSPSMPPPTRLLTNDKNCKLIYNSKILSLVFSTNYSSSFFSVNKYLFLTKESSKFCFSVAARFSALDLEDFFISAIIDFSKLQMHIHLRRSWEFILSCSYPIFQFPSSLICFILTSLSD